VEERRKKKDEGAELSEDTDWLMGCKRAKDSEQ